MKREISPLEQKVRTIVGGQNEAQEAKPKDETWERVQALVGGSGAKPVNVKLNTEEKLAMYDSILECLESGDSYESIAKNVVACVEDKLDELNGPEEEEFKVKGKRIKSPIFRRVE